MDPEPFLAAKCDMCDYYYVHKQLTRLSRMRLAIFERSPVRAYVLYVQSVSKVCMGFVVRVLFSIYITIIS